MTYRRYPILWLLIGLLLAGAFAQAQDDEDRATPSTESEVSGGIAPYPISNAPVTGDYETTAETFFVEEIAAVIDEINAWRIAQGLWPLAHNGVLEGMAASQADYLASLPRINLATIHNGRNGEDPRTRSQYPAFAWPTYGHPQRLSVTEIAGVGSVRSSMSFWRSSRIHTQSALSRMYREIGVAVRTLPGTSDKLYVVVLGARPNVLTAVPYPDQRVFYLSQEQREWDGDWIGYTSRFRLFDTDQSPLTDWQSYQRIVDLPPVSGDHFYVLSQGVGGEEVYTRVDLNPTYSLYAVAPVETVAPSASSEIATMAQDPLYPVSNRPVQSDYAVTATRFYVDEVATIIEEINAWRIAQGLWPLAHNGVLEDMAAYQAEFVVSEGDVQSQTIHMGALGEDVRVRSQLAAFLWPNYGNAGRVTIAEVAATGSVQSSLATWRSSRIDTQEILSRHAREIGVAVRDLPDSDDKLYVVVMGARPNVLTAVADPDAGVFYLSQEQREWDGDWISFTSRFRLFDSNQAPLGDWQSYRRVVDLPPVSGDHFYVLSEGINSEQVYTRVDLNPTYSRYTDDDAPVATVAAATMSEASTEPTTTPEATQQAPEPTTTPEATQQAPEPTTTPEATQQAPEPTTTPEPTPPAPPALTITYNTDTIVLRNSGQSAANFSGLTLVQGEIRLALPRWQVVAPGLNVADLPANHCLQAWSWNSSGGFAVPDACVAVRGILFVAPDDLFWLDGSFNVEAADGSVIATCDAEAGSCVVDLP